MILKIGDDDDERGNNDRLRAAGKFATGTPNSMSFAFKRTGGWVHRQAQPDSYFILHPAHDSNHIVWGRGSDAGHTNPGPMSRTHVIYSNPVLPCRYETSGVQASQQANTLLSVWIVETHLSCGQRPAPATK